MLNKMKRVAAGLLTAVFLLNISAVPGVNNVTQVEAASLVKKGKVKKSMKSKRITVLHKGDRVKLLSNNSKWVAVEVNGMVGYTQGRYISVKNGGTASDTTVTKGESVVNYALKFVGNPYRWGGTSLTRGADCSGFVMSVYRHFGKSLPHSSYAQRRVGRRVGSLSKAKPGDIICYSGHVAIYMGNNKVVHASNPRDGIKITNGAAYRSIVTIRRVF